MQPIIGLEIHVQLLTRTKMFCGCRVTFDAPPNSHVCPVCLGHPGALPVVNRRAVELAIRAGLALNCEIADITQWDRKSYYYPDMPKNYQISQYDMPICGHGHLDVPSDGETRRVRIRRAHLEEDAGKNIHDASGKTFVDLNRAGTPLLEIVTEPDLRSPEEAYRFCTELQRMMVYLGVTEGVMKKGQMRFEPNVNVELDEGHRTPIAEIKNLNSFRSVRNAIHYDVERQIAAWRDDDSYLIDQAPNENRGWNDDAGVTEYQRPKEAAHDYRYFPDPDLVPVRVSRDWIENIGRNMCELPHSRANRLNALGLSERDVETILGDRESAELFDAIVQDGANPAVAAKQFVNVWQKLANDRNRTVAQLPVDRHRMADLARLVAEGTISASAANRIAMEMLDTSDGPEALAQRLGLIQVRDTAAMEAWVDEAFAANPDAVADAQNPKKAKKVAGFLRGQVMKLSGGKADPKVVGELIDERLERR